MNKQAQELPESILSRYRWRDNTWYAGQLYHAVRTLQIHKIFLDTSGGKRDRLVFILGGCMGHAFYRDSHCWAVNDAECNPHKIMPDAYALAPYIGHHLEADKNRFGVRGDQILLNGEPFKIIGLRCSNALISDQTSRDLIHHLPTYRRSGINTVSVFFMGSRFGDVKGYRPDATLGLVFRRSLIFGSSPIVSRGP